MNLVWIFGLAKCTPFEKIYKSNVPGTCWDKNKLGKFQLFAAYYSAILDFVLAFIPWQILKDLTMKRREKIGVAVAMSLGAVAGATGIVKSVMVVHMTDPDITYSRVDLTIWTLSEPAVSIMAISIPVLYVTEHSMLRHLPLKAKTNNFQAHVVPRNQVFQPAKRRQRPQPTHIQRAAINALNEP
jgi:hypothetical protein